MHIMDTVEHGIFYCIVGAILLGGTIWYLRARQTVKKSVEIAARAAQKRKEGNGKL